MPDVLIVEDDPDIREDLAELLRSRGYAVSTAGNGSEALDALSGGDLPRVILLDLMMPVMNGWDFRTRMLQDAQLSRIPVVLLSGASDVQQHAAALHAADFVTKPIKLERLYATLACYVPVA
jgi:CheY-like chemotaxis protein